MHINEITDFLSCFHLMPTCVNIFEKHAFLI